MKYLKKNYLIILILILGLSLRLWNLNQSLWLDEAAQAIESSPSLILIWQNMTAVFHPPFFHLLMHFWLFLGKMDWQMRLLPVIFGLGSIILSYFLAKDLFNQKVAFLTALLLTTNPFHIYYSQELRPYMATLFFAVLSVYLFQKIIISKQKVWPLYTIINTIFLYTSYFAIFVLLPLLIFLIIIRKDKKQTIKMITSLFVSIILFLPWLPNILAQLKISSGFARDLPGWLNAVSTPIYKALQLTLVKFIIGQINFRPLVLYGFISSLMLSIWAFVIYKGKDWKNQNWILVFLIFTVSILLPVIFSFYLQVVAPKRLIYALPFLTILLGAGLLKLDNTKGKILLIILIVTNIYFMMIYQTQTNFQRENWKKAISDIETKSDINTGILFKFPGPLAPYLWYQKKNLQVTGISPTLAFNAQFLDQELPKFLTGKNKVYLFQYLGELTDRNKATEEILQRSGFIKVDTLNYEGVGLIDEYHFKI